MFYYTSLVLPTNEHGLVREKLEEKLGLKIKVDTISFSLEDQQRPRFLQVITPGVIPPTLKRDIPPPKLYEIPFPWVPNGLLLVYHRNQLDQITIFLFEAEKVEVPESVDQKLEGLEQDGLELDMSDEDVVEMVREARESG